MPPPPTMPPRKLPLLPLLLNQNVLERHLCDPSTSDRHWNPLDRCALLRHDIGYDGFFLDDEFFSKGQKSRVRTCDAFLFY